MRGKCSHFTQKTNGMVYIGYVQYAFEKGYCTGKQMLRNLMCE